VGYWLFDLATWAIGGLCALVFCYGALIADRQPSDSRYARLDRRAPESLDRRRRDVGGPHGLERRLGARRLSENL
jgi:hypothetical protein